MIQGFKTRGTEDIYNGINSREARRAYPQFLWRIATRKLDQLDSADALFDLKIPPGNHLEELSGKRSGQYSIRINDQFRVCFIWTKYGPDQIEITDYH